MTILPINRVTIHEGDCLPQFDVMPDGWRLDSTWGSPVPGYVDSQGLSSHHWHDECRAAAARMSASDREDCFDGWDAGDFDRGMTPSETGTKRRASE
jgi:hypothetical protein